MSDPHVEFVERAFGILHRLATENRRSTWRRWYYSDEPLRHDAAALIRDAGMRHMMELPEGARLVGDE